MRFFFLTVFTLLLLPCVACVCDQRNLLTLQECSSYDVVFLGEAQRLSSCIEGAATVEFNVTELYKGDVLSTTSVQYICGDKDCSVGFQIGSEWLIFANKNNAQSCVFDLCSHSREFLPDSLSAYYDDVFGTTFFQDKDFLVAHFEVNKKFNNQLKGRRYEKVDPKLIPVFLGVSLLFMLVGMVVFKRVTKSNEKK